METYNGCKNNSRCAKSVKKNAFNVKITLILHSICELNFVQVYALKFPVPVQ